MDFISKNCLFKQVDVSLVHLFKDFDCEILDLNDFFLNDCINYSTQLLGKSYCFLLKDNPEIVVGAFSVSNDSIKTKTLPNNIKKKVIKGIPHIKQSSSYPAVLIGRLGISKKYQRGGIGGEIMNLIKAWFTDSMNKTGCRFIVVDSYNKDRSINYYKKQGFNFLFPTEDKEKE